MFIGPLRRQADVACCLESDLKPILKPSYLIYDSPPCKIIDKWRFQSTGNLTTVGRPHDKSSLVHTSSLIFFSFFETLSFYKISFASINLTLVQLSALLYQRVLQTMRDHPYNCEWTFYHLNGLNKHTNPQTNGPEERYRG